MLKGLQATTNDPLCHSYWTLCTHALQQKKPLCEACTAQQNPSLTATRENLHAATKTQGNQNFFFMCMEFINIMNGKYTI